MAENENKPYEFDTSDPFRQQTEYEKAVRAGQLTPEEAYIVFKARQEGADWDEAARRLDRAGLRPFSPGGLRQSYEAHQVWHDSMGKNRDMEDFYNSSQSIAPKWEDIYSSNPMQNENPLSRSRQYKAADPSEYDPNALETYNKARADFEAKTEAYKDLLRKKHEEAGWGAPIFDGEEIDWGEEERKAKEAQMYRGQIPEGSMYVDGALIGQQDYNKEQEAEKKEAYSQFPWMEQLETLQPAQQPVQQQPIQQPMGNIAPNMPMFGQASEAKSPTTEGGVSRSYSAIGGSQFQPNDRKSQQPKYGGQNTGYEGTIAPSVNKLFGR